MFPFEPVFGTFETDVPVATGVAAAIVATGVAAATVATGVPVVDVPMVPAAANVASGVPVALLALLPPVTAIEVAAGVAAPTADGLFAVGMLPFA